MQAWWCFPNPTHIWIKGVIHRNQKNEGEVWQRPCHNLLALPPWHEWKVNVTSFWDDPWCHEERIRQSLMKNYEGCLIKRDRYSLDNPLVSHKVDQWGVDSKCLRNFQTSQWLVAPLEHRSASWREPRVKTNASQQKFRRPRK